MTDDQTTLPPAYDPGVPLHVQVREMIRRRTLSGELVDETGRLMTEAELVRHFGVSRVTIRNALAPLVDSGMFDRTPGRGTFLRDNRSEKWVGRLMGFQEIIAEAGYTPGARILKRGMVKAEDDEIRSALNERAVWELRRVRFADDRPIAIEHAWYPPDIGLELETRDLINIRMYQVFEQEMGLAIRSATQTISAKLSTPDEDRELALDGPAALTVMHRLTIAADGRPIELLHSLYRPDFFQFSIELNRSGF